MPSTKTKRVPGPYTINYNPLFPGGRNQDRPDNQRARVAIGDRALGEAIRADYESNFGKKKKK